jgi:hypothetical protein
MPGAQIPVVVDRADPAALRIEWEERARGT